MPYLLAQYEWETTDTETGRTESGTGDLKSIIKGYCLRVKGILIDLISGDNCGVLVNMQ